MRRLQQRARQYSADVAQDIKNSASQVVIPNGSPAELVIPKIESGGVASNPEVTLDLPSIKGRRRRYTVGTHNVRQSVGREPGSTVAWQHVKEDGPADAGPSRCTICSLKAAYRCSKCV
jgi:hypothetical protein